MGAAREHLAAALAALQADPPRPEDLPALYEQLTLVAERIVYADPRVVDARDRNAWPVIRGLRILWHFSQTTPAPPQGRWERDESGHLHFVKQGQPDATAPAVEHMPVDRAEGKA